MTNIFEPTKLVDARHAGSWRLLFPQSHKTVFKFDRTVEGVRVINVDGTYTSAYFSLPMIEMVNAPEENVKLNNRPMTHLDVYQGITKPDDRQKSGFECGIFSIQDACQVNRDSRFDEGYLTAAVLQPNYLNNTSIYKYLLPAAYMKS